MSLAIGTQTRYVKVLSEKVVMLRAETEDRTKQDRELSFKRERTETKDRGTKDTALCLIVFSQFWGIPTFLP